MVFVTFAAVSTVPELLKVEDDPGALEFAVEVLVTFWLLEGEIVVEGLKVEFKDSVVLVVVVEVVDVVEAIVSYPLVI